MRVIAGEKSFLSAVVAYARLTGWTLYHTYDSRRSTSGFPDLVLLREADRRLVWVELKTEKGKLTTAQEKWIDLITACGQEVYVWRPTDWKQIEEVLKQT